jgi:hypothetical protein
MIVKTILVKKHSFGSFEVDSIGPVSETANDIRDYRIYRATSHTYEKMDNLTPTVPFIAMAVFMGMRSSVKHRIRDLTLGKL